jgi:hypothetical protein
MPIQETPQETRRKDNINHQIFTGKNTREFGEIKGSGRAGISDA